MQHLILAFLKFLRFEMRDCVSQQVMEFLKKLAGAEYVGFCNAT